MLLNEFEKAYTDIQNKFLEAMDTGWLTDNRGECVDVSNMIFIVTSNAGAAHMHQTKPTFEDRDGDATPAEEAIGASFSQALQDRLDGNVIL